MQDEGVWCTEEGSEEDFELCFWESNTVKPQKCRLGGTSGNSCPCDVLPGSIKH